MILVDTSVWVEHFRRGSAALAALLGDGHVLCHPFVIGELACGKLRRREEILLYLSNLERLAVAEHEEVLALVGERRLMGTGIGWIDAHLLASAALYHATLWTLDRPLAESARRLGLAAQG